jgi:hypothetical protein
MNKHSYFNGPRFTLLLIALVMVAVQACSPTPINVNAIQSISLAPGQTLALDTPIQFILGGTGKCTSVSIDWGDGSTDPIYTYASGGPIDLSGSDHSAIDSRTLTHTFTGWGGGKTVTVDGTVNGNVQCLGRVNLRFEVPPLEQTIGWNTATPAGTVPGGTRAVCRTPTPPWPDLIPRMLVHATASLVGGGGGIDFGCFAGGCVYDADGKPGSVADSRFPFPGLKEWSVVYMVGSPLGSNTQVELGGTDIQFTTRVGGPLEFCLNDGDQDLTDNKGGFVVTLSVDQLGP